MRTPLPHASLTDLRDAIRASRAVRFTYRGVDWTVEPHELGQAKRTAALILRAWVAEGPVPQEWVVFRYSEIRNLEVLPRHFGRQHQPLPHHFVNWGKKPKRKAVENQRMFTKATV